MLNCRHLPLWAAGVWLLCALSSEIAAQGTRPRPNTATSLRALESKAQEARDSYLAQLNDLAKGYEDSGDIERAQEALAQVLKINPDDARVKAKIKELQDKVYNENQRVIEVESTRGWISTGLRVTRGEPIRLQAEGSYKFIVNTDLGPDGFSTKNVMQDMGAGVDCGALMGVVVGDPSPRNRSPQPGEPFQIGREVEHKPSLDGLLFVRLNVPPGSKCIGKVKVMVSGHISPSGG